MRRRQGIWALCLIMLISSMSGVGIGIFLRHQTSVRDQHSPSAPPSVVAISPAAQQQQPSATAYAQTKAHNAGRPNTRSQQTMRREHHAADTTQTRLEPEPWMIEQLAERLRHAAMIRELEGPQAATHEAVPAGLGLFLAQRRAVPELTSDG